MPTPFADQRGERLVVGETVWVLIDTVLKGNIITPELRAEGEFALAEVEVENQGRATVVFGPDALVLVDSSGARHHIGAGETALLAEIERGERCLGLALEPGARRRCRVLFDVVPAPAATSKLELYLRDLGSFTTPSAVVKLEFLGVEPQPRILESTP